MNRTKRGIALLLALVMCISLLPATIAQAEGETGAEYVISIDAFNTSNMTEKLSGYKTAPVLRKGKNTLYYTDAMSWDYVIPVEHAKDGVAFNAMNLEETAPWKLEGYKASGDVVLGADYLQLAFDSSTFGSDAPAYASFRLVVEEAGTYNLQANAEAVAAAAVPAVYFAKADSDESTLLGYYDVPSSNGYTTLGSVEVEAGEYIVSFICDATSAEKNAIVGTSMLGEIVTIGVLSITIICNRAGNQNLRIYTF